MKYIYDDLSDSQFETLVVLICQRILGLGVQPFAMGPDGGRDAKFVGTAELIPSSSAPWEGTTIVQAKHANGFNQSFSEHDFFSIASDDTILGKEFGRIRALRAAGELDNYLLVSNRRLTGLTESRIRSEIASRCDIPIESIIVCGTELLEVWLKRFPEIAAAADLDLIDSPLLVSSDLLAEVVEAMARSIPDLRLVPDAQPTDRVTFDTKNRLNGMSSAYANELRRRFLKETTRIQSFLAAPENLALQAMYESVVEEFQLGIIAKRKNYQSFDDVMNYLRRLLFDRDPVLRQHGHRKLTSAVLFYMYWNCDIGDSDNVAPN